MIYWYNGKEIGRLKTEVHFLKPINYDEYKELNTHQIAELVKTRIQEKLDEIAESKKKEK
jgi:1-acyl-sn-glycerol-3-phosphate acyltransferase